MVKKPKKELKCGKCGLTIKQSAWTLHWQNVHKIYRRNARKVLGEDQWPTNPQWLESDDKFPMVSVLVNDTTKNVYLPVILKCLLTKDKKIPWHLRDYTYKLLAANEIETNWLDWGKITGTRNKVSQREKDNYQDKPWFSDPSFIKKGYGKFMKAVIPTPL